MNERNIKAFDHDVDEFGGYQYTGERLSSRVANQRLSTATRAAYDFQDKSVIDIGCGDGTYTIELLSVAHPKTILGIDPAKQAIDRARRLSESLGDSISFQELGAYDLPFEDSHFDVAHIRGVLHHLNEPSRAVREALRVSKSVVIIEPNGFNPILKVLEKVSPYHRAHDEQSFSSFKIDSWITAGGGRVVKRHWANLVPMFCPDWMAIGLLAVQPAVERIPIVSQFACSVYVVAACKHIAPE